MVKKPDGRTFTGIVHQQKVLKDRPSCMAFCPKLKRLQDRAAVCAIFREPKFSLAENQDIDSAIDYISNGFGIELFPLEVRKKLWNRQVLTIRGGDDYKDLYDRCEVITLVEKSKIKGKALTVSGFFDMNAMARISMGSRAFYRDYILGSINKGQPGAPKVLEISEYITTRIDDEQCLYDAEVSVRCAANDWKGQQFS